MLHLQAHLTTAQAHSASHSVLLGGTVDSIGELVAGLELPPNASSITLTYWWLVEGQEPEAYGDHLITILNHPGGDDDLAWLPADAPKGEWYAEAIDLTEHAGEPISLTFHAHNNDSIPTSFYLDDVEVEVCYAAPEPRRLYLPLVLKRVPG